MKRYFVLLLVILIACLSVFAAVSETLPENPELLTEEEIAIPSLSGVVIEITDDGYLLETGESGMVLVKSDAETIVDASGEIAVGDYISVVYDGIMSRSIPAQITADLIRMYSITGKIISADPENNGVLLETQTHGEVYAHLPEPWLENTAETLVVYFDGAMTMSLPPQISGQHVVSLGE